jgi:uncharacterized protein (DUF58 family)
LPAASPVPATELRGPYADLATLVRLRHLKLRGRRKRPLNRSSHAGMRLSRLRGRGIDFAEVRAYHPGDDVRNIDWRVTARKAKPHTKIYREERERPTMIIVDQTQRMFFGTRTRFKSVTAAETAALLGWQALSTGDRVGGIVFDNVREHIFKPYRSSRTLVRFLHQVVQSNQSLSRLGSAPPRDTLATALERLRRLAPVGYRVFIVSDFAEFDSHHEPLLVSLTRHNTVVALPVHDPMEQELPPPGSYVVRDGSGRIDLDAADRNVRRRYRRRFERARDALTQACQRTGIQLVGISTELSTSDQIGGRLAS